MSQVEGAVKDLEFYATQQELVGEEICRINRNYGKDPEKRKTFIYLSERRDSLDRNWEKFDETDSIIREGFSDQLDHPYFKRDYFEAVRKIAERLRSDLNRRIELFQAEGLVQLPHEEDTDREEIGEVAAVSYPKGALHTGAIPKGKVEPPPVPRISQPSGLSIQPRTMPRESMNQKERFVLLMNILDRSLDKCSAEISLRRTRQFCQIKARSIEQNWDELSALYRKLEDQVTENDVGSYFNMQERVETVLMQLYEISAEPQTASAQINPSMKLPKIELPKFDGSYLNWRQFYDLFKQLIHDQPISPAQKLYYLRANVTGDAHNLIQHFQATDSNYEIAWSTLVERFDNKRLLLTAQLNRLLAQPINHRGNCL